MKRLTLLALLFLPFVLQATEIEWNLKNLHGVTQSGFDSIISDAKSHFATNPDDTIIKRIAMNKKQQLELNLANGGGCAVRFSPVDTKK